MPKTVDTAEVQRLAADGALVIEVLPARAYDGTYLGLVRRDQLTG